MRNVKTCMENTNRKIRSGMNLEAVEKSCSLCYPLSHGCADNVCEGRWRGPGGRNKNILTILSLARRGAHASQPCAKRATARRRVRRVHCGRDVSWRDVDVGGQQERSQTA